MYQMACVSRLTKSFKSSYGTDLNCVLGGTHLRARVMLAFVPGYVYNLGRAVLRSSDRSYLRLTRELLEDNSFGAQGRIMFALERVSLAFLHGLIETAMVLGIGYFWST